MKKEKDYTKYYTTSAYKLLSRYGGAGSIVETTEYSIQIESVSRWPFILAQQHILESNEVEDKRFLNRLRKKAFPELKRLYRVPDNSANFIVPTQPGSLTDVAQGFIFPSWFYCPRCSRLRTIPDWHDEWNKAANRNDAIHNFKAQCGWCKEKANSKKQTGFELQQTNFVVASKSGYLGEVPWNAYLKGVGDAIEQDDDETGERVRGKLNHLGPPCCDKPDLRYEIRSNTSDLQGITIRCNECNTSKSLSNLFSLTVSGGEGNNPRFPNRVFTKSTNSLYQPLTLQSLLLPSKSLFTGEQLKELVRSAERKKWDRVIEDMKEFMPDISESEIQNQLAILGHETDLNSAQVDEIEYRRAEYRYLVDTQQNDSEFNSNLRLKRYDFQLLKQFFVSSIVAARSLKMTTVQIGYTRLEASSPDQYLADTDRADKEVVRKFITDYKSREQYLPAVESYGEGIFIGLDSSKLVSWSHEILLNREYDLYFDSLLDKISESPFFGNMGLRNKVHLVNFILLHSLSHILIKELEFLCGYPAASMHERIYCDGSSMAGILIYAMAGAEGTYGGLVTQANPEKLNKIFESALWRAKDCASDPVCYRNTHPSKETPNSASCYACMLLPETACDHINGLLDRRLLIDQEFGFFKSI